MPLPFGWFCVAYSDELQVGEAKPLRYFGKDLVLFRTESGKAVVLDAYCPHLGAHLGHGIHEETGIGGRIEGETIVCPFHAWRFNGNGRMRRSPLRDPGAPQGAGQAVSQVLARKGDESGHQRVVPPGGCAPRVGNEGI